MRKTMVALAMAGAVSLAAVAMFGETTKTQATSPGPKPTILLVHGAFADASSWNGVIAILEGHGFPVLAAANPLRSVETDAKFVSDILSSITSPVVLVGHSYGGAVITQAAVGHPNVKALVYVGAFAPDKGETAGALSAKFPGSTLGAALAPPVPLSNGGKDLYIQNAKFQEQFAADVSSAEAKLMAAGQRPITESALGEPASAAAWKTIPSWFIYGEKDKNIPAQALAFMAKRARSKETIAVAGASHVVMVSNAGRVAGMIERAAAVASPR
jgi:pimeloyl-ACP methyl ester carboxylesterase